MTFVLKADPVGVARRFGFFIESKTPLQHFFQPLIYVGSGKGVQCLQIEGNDYLCMWCSRETKASIGLPIDHINSKVKIAQTSATTGDLFYIKETGDFSADYKTFGVFCCLQCARAFWEERKHQPEFEMAGFFLQQIWEIEYGVDVPFDPAPPRETLKIFGGSLSFEEFHRFPPQKLSRVKMFFSTVVFDN